MIIFMLTSSSSVARHASSLVQIRIQTRRASAFRQESTNNPQVRPVRSPASRIPKNPLDPVELDRVFKYQRLTERGWVGNPSADLFLQAIETADLSIPEPWIPFLPPRLAEGSSILDRLRNTLRQITSNLKARRQWFKSERGLNLQLKALQSMFLLASERSFYHPPPRPPWSSLPLSALSPPLAANTPRPPPPTKKIPEGGTFIPLATYSSSPETDMDRMPDPYTSIGNRVELKLLRGKYPYSTQLMKWMSQKTDGKDWIEGFRWSCMESYLKHLHAYATGDKVALELLTTESYQKQMLAGVEARRLAHVEYKLKGLNRPSKPNPRITYVWKFHGPTSGPGVIIQDIRARVAYYSADRPICGNEYIVQALVSFDTLQSLEVYDNNRLVKGNNPEPRRVVEDFILEKRMYYPVPWTLKKPVFDRTGVVEPRFWDLDPKQDQETLATA